MSNEKTDLHFHAHTFHMTLLGLAALYNATGNPEYRDVVLGSVDRLADEWVFPSSGRVTIHVEPEQAARFALHLRIPPYAAGAEVWVGDGEPVAAQAGEFAVIEREWRAGDSVQLSLPFQVSCHANDHVLALVRGPLVYADVQDAQADPGVFHRRRGLYPEDAVLRIDPDQPDQTVQEEVAPNGLLGPALRVAGVLRSKAPMFAAPAGNSGLPEWQEQSLTLLPFANQGAIRGPYRVFVDYTRPTE